MIIFWARTEGIYLRKVINFCLMLNTMNQTIHSFICLPVQSLTKLIPLKSMHIFILCKFIHTVNYNMVGFILSYLYTVHIFKIWYFWRKEKIKLDSDVLTNENCKHRKIKFVGYNNSNINIFRNVCYYHIVVIHNGNVHMIHTRYMK